MNREATRTPIEPIAVKLKALILGIKVLRKRGITNKKWDRPSRAVPTMMEKHAFFIGESEGISVQTF